jgi:hypothetical protein
MMQLLVQIGPSNSDIGAFPLLRYRSGEPDVASVDTAFFQNRQGNSADHAGDFPGPRNAWSQVPFRGPRVPHLVVQKGRMR